MKREFKGIWIPKSIWLNKELSFTEKLILVEIESYDNDFGCVATNKTLCEDLQIQPSTASGVIKSLELKGFIQIEYKNYNTFEGRKITVNKDPFGNPKPPSEKSEPPSEKSIPSNTFSNTFSKEDTKVSIVGLPSSTPTDGETPLTKRCQMFVNRFNMTKVVNGKPSKYRSNKSLCSALKNRLKVYDPKLIIQALKVAMTDEYHIKTNFKYVTPEYILRENILERYVNIETDQVEERGLVL